MKKSLLFVFAVIFLASCEKGADSSMSLKKYSDMASEALLAYKAPEVMTLAAKKADKNFTPLKSSGSGTISYNLDGCGSGTMQLLSVGTGNSTHLGSFKQTTTVCLNASTGQLAAPVIGIGVAANGDQLIYTFTGAGVDPATGYMFQTYVITGGTGRFVNATGNMTLTYQVNTPTNFSYTGDGQISY